MVFHPTGKDQHSPELPPVQDETEGGDYILSSTSWLLQYLAPGTPASSPAAG
jgi:hypothetical protein